MNKATPKRTWFADATPPGERAWHDLVISESVAGRDITIPVYVWKGKEPGPIVSVTAAVHGDEINGTGTIRSIITDPPFELQRGTLVMVPVVNILGFELHSRYLPDRRDLNRTFPGSASGSLASRLAHSFFNQLTKHCDFGIDLHTAAVRRTNFPNVRADLSIPELHSFARAFGTELVIDGKGPKGSLRSAATKEGCLTVILEAGEVWKVESSIVEYSIRGITNCLRYLKMLEGKPTLPAYRLETDAATWIRASVGGFLEFHVGPGDIVHEDDAIATSWNLGGEEVETIRAPRDGIILGMTTIPSVAPGDPVVHLTYPKKGSISRIERLVDKLDDESLHERTREDLSRSFVVTEHEDQEE